MENITIYTHRIKGSVLFLGSCAFVAIGLWLVIMPEKFDSGYSSVFIKVAGIIGVLFFGFCGIIALRIIIFKKIALLINQNGILINPGAKGTTIKWNDITNFREVKIRSTKLIAIDVKEPQYYIDQQPNNFKKRVMQFNLNNYGSPYAISSGTYTINHNDLLDILNMALGQNSTHTTLS